MTHNQVTTSIGGRDDRQAVLGVLADPISRSILEVISGRMLTAAEVAERMEIPLSTVYRKLDDLVDSPVVESGYRVKSHGKHPRQYRCTVDRITISMPDERGGTVSINVA